MKRYFQDLVVISQCQIEQLIELLCRVEAQVRLGLEVAIGYDRPSA
jgi:hypothetical protein